MILVKNSFGSSVIPNPTMIDPDRLNQFSGSSLDRSKPQKKEKTVTNKALLKEKQLRCLSQRTKTKIRRKILAFFGLYKRLSFVTLTYLNKVDDELALKVFQLFLDNVKKLDSDFQYIWVAERQTKNIIFKNNIHFHLITNKYWKIDQYKTYWIKLQNKNGIQARDASFKPSSSFDVKQVTSNNVKGILNYLTKYITKNDCQFRFSPWNCSKKISELYTSFYTDLTFIEQLEELEMKNMISIKRVREDFYNLMVIPYNSCTMPFYSRLHKKNRENWFKKLD